MQFNERGKYSNNLIIIKTQMWSYPLDCSLVLTCKKYNHHPTPPHPTPTLPPPPNIILLGEIWKN